MSQSRLPLRLGAACWMLMLLARHGYGQENATVTAEREMYAKKLSMALKQPSTSAYLLEMARKADVNIIADATNFRPTAPPLTGEWETSWSAAKAGQWSGPLGGLLLQLADAHQLTLQRHAAGTYLLWSRPELSSFGRELLVSAPVGQNIVERLVERQAGRVPGEREVEAMMRDYLERIHGWQVVDKKGAVSQDFPAIDDIKLSDLPPEMSAQILDYCRRQVVVGSSAPVVEHWFSDDFWKGAVLQVHPHAATVRGKPRARLMVGGIVGQSEQRTVWNFWGVDFVDDFDH